jgi:ABC-2 type transport system permease protein
MMILLAVTMFLSVFGIVALGIGFGALYPNFRHENIAQVATGFGGVFYMITTAVFLAAIILLEAGPVYMIYMADYRGQPITTSQWLFIVPSFIAVLIVNGVAVYKPMKMGLESLRRYE